MSLDYYVYLLLDSSKPGVWKYGDLVFDHEPFYIGKGKGDRIKNTTYDKLSFKGKKLAKLKSNNIEIISKKLFESLTNTESIEKEKYLISLIGRRDLDKGPLVNTTDGGDGRLNSKHSEEIKSKISKSRKGKAIGWKHKPETLKAMSQKQSGEGNGFWGKTHSEEVKIEQSRRVSGLSHPMLDKKHNDESKRKLVKHRNNKVSNDKIKQACQKFNKEVLMFDLEFNFLREFRSVKETSEVTGINASVISKCCRGEIKSPTRFYFRYKNQKDEIKHNKWSINEGDSFEITGKKYKLLKRNKKTCICVCDDNLETLHVRDYSFLFEKETNLKFPLPFIENNLRNQ